MKKSIILLTALALSSVSAMAEESSDAPSLGMSYSLGYESEYLFHSVQYANSILTPSINAFYGNFYAGTWFACPIANESYWSNEMDLYVGYSFALSDLITLDVGSTHYSYDNCIVGFLHPNNSIDAHATFIFNLPWSPSVTFTHDFDCLTYVTEFKVSNSFDLAKDLSVGINANAGREWGEDDHVDYSFWGCSIDLSYAINESASISVGPRYAGSTEEYYIGDPTDPDPTKNAFWYGFNFSSSF